MKKVLLVAAVAGLTMVSCKKDYTCECTTTSNMPGFNGATSSGQTGKMKKDEAETKCNSGDSESSVTAGGTTYTTKVDCNIKE